MVTSQMQILVEVFNPKFGTYYLSRKIRKEKIQHFWKKSEQKQKGMNYSKNSRSKGHSLK